MNKKPLKVLFYNDFQDIVGGTEIYQKLMVEGLKHYGHQVEEIFGTTQPFPKSNFYFKLWMLSSALSWKSKIAQSVENKIKEFQPDIVHLNNNKLYTYTLLKTCNDLGVPVVSSFHDFHFLKTGSSDFFLVVVKIWKSRLRALLKKYQSAFLSHTRIVAKSLEDHNLTPVKIIPLFYDERIWFKSDIDIQNKQKTILFFGRIEEQKGIFDLLEAFENLKPKFPELRLSYYGSGTANKKLIKAIANSPYSESVIYHGRVNQGQLNQAAQKALLLVVPTKIDEPFGLTGIEGQAAGLIAIGSNKGGIPEWCIHEKTGLLFEAGNIADLSEKINRVLIEDHSRQQLLKGGKDNVENFFNRLSNIKKTVDYYYQLVENHQLKT